ncbi:HNH endonuclease [Streptomyces sp. A1136]|uniref:HNH endonuclease n=1 Tax=Streptomyces sp. A1136 TaxID=2563102 RepID=UPI00109ECA1C|nr:HNH endonuclease [Streptomyces sp. A1136]
MVARVVLEKHIASQGYYCPGYGVAPHAATDLTVDHIVPRSKGGSDQPDNLRVLCRACNSSKHNK